MTYLYNYINIIGNMYNNIHSFKKFYLYEKLALVGEV